MGDYNYFKLSLLAEDGDLGAMIDLARYALSIKKYDLAFECISKAVMLSDYIDSSRTIEAYEEYASLHINGRGCEKSAFMAAFCYYSIYILGEKTYHDKLTSFVSIYKAELINEVQYKLVIAQIEINSIGAHILPRKDYNFFIYLLKELSFSSIEITQFTQGVEILDVDIEKISDVGNTFEVIYFKKQAMNYINKCFTDLKEKQEALKQEFNKSNEEENQMNIIKSFEDRAKNLKNNLSSSYSTLGDTAQVIEENYYAAYNYYNGICFGSKDSYDKLNGIIDKKDVYTGLNQRIQELFSFISGNKDIKFETNEFDFILFLMKYYDFQEKDIKAVDSTL
ncbi:hypothetical protein [Lachnoclostridium phytofermentans]|uniref:Uncharacterized protein n=1 Tax=Lachnoclostridium phytofermentans (strain ATCC 700394 / DSM 18823 / ISDg) TaxID=357809 RepID=A9KLH6_LACP7|nr:hypothetical protein [Lachnoclostridium phytofermentans]ABX41305.1 hypothetical protein Cphy_0920 [Lachnoclostridium phytofermentans ISDg]